LLGGYPHFMSIAKFLSTVEGFKRIDHEDLEDIAANIEEQDFSKGTYIIRKNDPGDNMYVLVEGRVSVPIFDESGSEKMVFHLGPGDLVGEMALLTGEPRSADVIADTDVSCLVFARTTLEPLLTEYPLLAGFLSEILGRRLEEDGGIQQVGKYRLFGKIGEGTSGKVYKALHPGLGRIVAVKMLLHSLSYNAQFCERFLNEARMVASLSHPNIVNVFDTETAYATYFIVMEKLTGTDLSAVLAERSILSPAEAAPILRQTAMALSYAHEKGFAHRDIKPANITISDDERVKLVDFGIARPIPETLKEKNATTVDGTPHYLAPETALGRPTDGRVDIYALGVVAFEMLTGRLPFEAKKVSEMLRAHVRTEPPDIKKLQPDLPEGMIEFVKGALIKDPQKRLCDPVKILKLLDLDGALGEFWTEAQEEVVRVRYLPFAAKKVDQAINALHKELSVMEGVEMARAHLEPVKGEDE